MAKRKNNPAPNKKKTLPWQALLTVAVIIAGVATYVFLETPTEEDLDLSIIEQGGNVVVQIHDPN